MPAHAITRENAGELHLHNRPEGGLRVGGVAVGVMDAEARSCRLG
ncbi:hypothetical protein [Pseudomonas sp. zfem005]|nr:hypothetical protein [Pseudomonas sp. zfem005]MDU9415801.1 hypothetical protein [Pseudomonas sp. zfem005]